jgi:hypothetical protein
VPGARASSSGDSQEGSLESRPEQGRRRASQPQERVRALFDEIKDGKLDVRKATALTQIANVEARVLDIEFRHKHHASNLVTQDQIQQEAHEILSAVSEVVSLEQLEEIDRRMRARLLARRSDLENKLAP